MYQEGATNWYGVPTDTLIDAFENVNLMRSSDFIKLKTLVKHSKWTSAMKLVKKYGIDISYSFKKGTWDLYIPKWQTVATAKLEEPKDKCNSIW